MQIDWLTVAAQIVNFLVLIWLLKRFLYTPISRAVARREARIEERLSDAREARLEALEEAENLRRRQSELEESREAVLDEAREEAGKLRSRLETEAREDTERKRRAWLEQVEQDREEHLHDLRKSVAGHTFTLARRVLKDISGAELEAEIAERFITKLKALDTETLSRLAEAAGREGAHARVESGVALPAPVRARITRALHDTISDRLTVDYATDETLFLGLRLTLGNQTVEWSADMYLGKLEVLFDEALELETRQSATDAA